MIAVRKAEDRGHADIGWLNTHYTFSFANYYDPQWNGYRSLRVLNDDTIAPGRGFGAHGHRDMEIVTYVLSGKLAHKDSMGERHVIGPNTVQAMSAGTGIVHSEFNGSETEPCHLLQIWITPSREDFEPRYQQIDFAPSEKQGKLRKIAGPDHAPGHTHIHQDSSIYAVELSQGQQVQHALAAGRYGWVQVASGSVDLNGVPLNTGDAAAIDNESILTLRGTGEVLLFDLA